MLPSLAAVLSALANVVSWGIDAPTLRLSPVDSTRSSRPIRVGAVSHRAVLEANTGISHGLESWREGREKQAVLRRQTERLADILQDNGIPVRLPCAVQLVGDVTRCVEQAEAWRSIRFLPLVAQRDRKPTQNALSLWLRGPQGRHARYAVVTSGGRVPLGGNLKERMSEHTANIRRWASEANSNYGVEVFMRATEFTVNDDGIHLHSNLVYRPSKRLTKVVWREFLAWSRKRLRAHWKDCGLLKDASEVVKYAVKPADLDAMADEHVVWLFGQTYRAKLVQPLGQFSDWLKGLERDRLKVSMVHKVGKSRLCLVAKAEREPAEGNNDGPGENVILGRTLPQARWCPYAEPVSLVMGYTENPVTPQGVRRLAILNERSIQARAWWDAAGAPDPSGADIRVHTDRPTVQATNPVTSTLTLADGTVIDRDTGEILFEPPDGAAEARDSAAAELRQAHELVTQQTADRLAAWHAAAPAREAAQEAAMVERELRAGKPSAMRKRTVREVRQATAYASWLAARC